MTNYRDNLNVLRRAFPQPVSDQEHDAWFVFSVLRAARSSGQNEVAAADFG